MFIKNLLAAFALSLLPIALHAQFGKQLQNLDASGNTSLRSLSAHDLDGDGDLDVLATYIKGVFGFTNDGTGNFSNGTQLLDVDLSGPSGSNLGTLPAQFRDLDADGLADIAAGKYWRKNLGNGQFAPPDSAWWQPLAGLCDVNSDGLPDAIYHSTNSLFWCRNLGGAFAPFQVISTATGWKVFAVADLNADGKEDLLVLRNSQLYWFKNTGDNDFQEILLDAGLARAAAIGDVDGNGKPDVLAGFANQVKWWEFDAAGNRTLRQSFSINNFQYGLSLGDLDGDGDLDLLLGNSGGASFRTNWYRLESNGLFSTTPNPITNPGSAYDIAALADFDGNNHTDILGGQFAGANQFALLRNQTIPGSFDPAILVGEPFSYINQILPADLDLDGDLDLIAADFLIEKTGPGQYAGRKKINLPHVDLQLADLNGDNLPDAVYPFVDAVAWQRNLGGLKFGPRVLLDGFVAQNKNVGIADLDKDGDLDLTAAIGTEANSGFENFIWFENDGVGNFTEHLIEEGTDWVREVMPLDVNEDGLPDLVLTFLDDKPARWYPNLGNGNFGAWQLLFTPATIQPARINQRMLVDLDDNGKIDIVYSTMEYDETEVFWYQNLGGGIFSEKKILLTIDQNASYGTPYFTVLDADNDGKKDVVVNDSYWRRTLFFKGTGGGDFAPSQLVFDDPTNGGFLAIVPYDVDDDGTRDLLFGNSDVLNKGVNALSWISGKAPQPPQPLTCPANIWYTEQSQIDSFPVRYPDCRVIEGNIILIQYTSNNAPTIDNLNGFRNIHTVRGGVYIWYNSLPDLLGLDSLRTIGTDLEITEGEALKSLEGLGSLRSVGRNLQIDKNKTLSGISFLKNLHGLEKLERVGGSVQLYEQGLETLNGLDQLSFIGATLEIQGDKLQDLQGLEHLDSVGNVVLLNGLKRLKSLHGLENLRHAGLNIIGSDSLVNLQGLGNWQSGKGLQISANKLLETLDGIESLQSLEGYDISGSYQQPVIWLSENPKLQDLSALNHPVTLPGDGIFIFQNPSLSNCAVEAICAYLPGPPDTVSIFGNLADCNSAAEILNLCTSSAPDVSGSVDFKIYPNPISGGQSLQILLKNDFFGQLKIELLDLNGRLVQAFIREKTNEVFSENLDLRSNLPGMFVLRVSDGRSVASRLIIKVD